MGKIEVGGNPGGLTLRKLEAFPGLGLSGLLAFFLAGIAGEEIVFPKDVAEIRIGLQKCPGNPQLDRADLAANPTAGGADVRVVLVGHIGGLERMKHLVLKRQSAEIIFESAFVDRDLSSPGDESDSGGGGFAASGG